MPHAALSLPLALLVTVSLSACGKTEPIKAPQHPQELRQAALAKRMKAACASNATYDRLKQVVFDEAIQIRNADPVNLDRLSTHSLARVENPVVKSRDEALDVTICSGRFILQVPPGAERAFEGKRQLAADIEYAAQAAADGSGLVYRIKGAEPIVYSLAAFDLRGGQYRAPAVASRPPNTAVAGGPAGPRAAPDPAPTFAPDRTGPQRTAAAPPAAARPVPTTPTPRTARAASPSFNCGAARSRSERLVCGSDSLAALDREMSSQFYSELERGDRQVRAELRRSRDRFLAYRNRCRDEDCVAQAYRDRMDEIGDIAGGR